MKWFAPLLIFCCFFSACKKKKDETPPDLIILSPVAKNTYDVPETISVKAIVKDNENIEFVSIRLVDENLQPVLPTTTNTTEGTYYELNQGYLLDDTHLETGKYFVRIVASDGTNETKEYIEVSVNELPLEKLGIALVSVINGSQVDVSVYDQQNQQVSPVLTFNGDYGGSALSSYHQQMVIAPYSSGQLTCFNLETKEVEWTKSSLYEYPHLGLYEDIYYTSSTEGFVKGYTKTGSNNFSATTQSGYYPLKSFKHGEWMLVHEKEATGGNKNLSSYYVPGGAFSGELLPFNYELIHAATMDEGRAVLFLNDGGNGRIFILYTPETESHYTWEPHTMNEGKITAACQIDDDNYIIATENGVFWYRYSFNSSTTFSSDQSASVVKYDAINNQVIVAKGSQLNFYNYPNGSLAGSMSHAYSIRNFFVWNNK